MIAFLQLVWSTIKQAWSTYYTNLRAYLIILSPILIPLIVVRFIARFTYFGNLTIVLSTTIGIVLNILFLFVIIMLILASRGLINKPIKRYRFRQLYSMARNTFIPFLGLFLIVVLIILSVPIILTIITNSVSAPATLAILNIFGTAWIVCFTLLLLFTSYSLILEKHSPLAALKRGITLFLIQPFKTTFHFGIATILFGLLFTTFAMITNVIIAVLTRQTDLLFNPELAEIFNPWWENLVIDVYAYLGLPLIVILTTILFYQLKDHEARTNHRIRDPRPAQD